MVYESVAPSELKINEIELSARLSMPCADVHGKYKELYESLLSVSKPAYVAERVDFKRENGKIVIGNVHSESKALSRLLSDADRCMAIVATLGVGVDRLLMKVAQTSAADAFVIDAMADALIEALCDLAESRVTSGGCQGRRFSPGYADIELAIGRELIIFTAAERVLGIKLSESGLMIPKKSVNAMITIKKEGGV